MDSKKGRDLNWGAMLWAGFKMMTPFYGMPSLELTTKVLQRALLGTIDAPVDHKAMQQKLNVAMSALNEASTYMGDLERKLTVQIESLDAVRASYSHYQQLADVEKSRAEAFIHEMATKINEGVNRERMWAFAINIVAGAVVFVVGVIASDKVKSLWDVVSARF